MGNSKLPEKIIEYSFYVLFFLVPLIWLPINSELFEFNKMILVYLVTSIVIAAWLFKSVDEKAFGIKRTPLDLPIAIFLLANIISTIFSIDRQTSFFGFYSRWNGGLLSTFSYLILYYALGTFFDKEKLYRLLKVMLASGFFVAIYAILQHPNPLFHNPDGTFRGIDAGYWQQDAQTRAFSTLGHPNWLAAFILMITPFALFFLASANKIFEKLFFTIALIAYFLAFTFTYSRGGTIGFIVMLGILLVGSLFIFKKTLLNFLHLISLPDLLKSLYRFKTLFFLLIVISGWLLTLYLFSNALLSRGVDIKQIKAAPAKQAAVQAETQLTNPGTETGKIRLIVWRGAWDIFKHYPAFGSGVETFAFSYYKFRSAEHNLTSEWDYLYNKAHNEFLNYLATTGSFGFFAYLLLIITSTYLVLKYLLGRAEIWQKYFVIAVLASYGGYHAQNIFGFSVVPIALLFYTLPALFFVITQRGQLAKINLNFLKSSRLTNLAKAGVLFIAFILLSFFEGSWAADYYYNKGIDNTDYLESYKEIAVASSFRPDEPLYKAYLAIPTVSLALEASGKEKEDRINEAIDYLNQAVTIAPNNLTIWQLRLQAFYTLSLDSEKYIPQTVKTAQTLASLAPNEAEIQYNLATIYVFAADYQKAQSQLVKVVNLKFDYKEAWKLLLRVDTYLKDEIGLKKHSSEFKKYFPTENIK